MFLKQATIFRLGLFAAFIIAIFSNLVCRSPLKPDEPAYLNLNDSVKYVGMNTCKTCHQNIFETFTETGMGKSFDHATRQKSSAQFDSHTVVHDSASGMSYHPYWDKDSLYIIEFRLKGKDTLYKRTETVKYIIGSGQHTNSHILDVNGYLYQAPLTFYTQSGKWDLPPGFEHGANSRFSRMIGLECMSCHNSYPGFEQGSENKFSSVPNGITCERCHGPGEVHVKEKLAGHLKDISKEIDYSIVNPAKLSPALQFDLCSRCHLQGNTVLNEGKSFTDFKPGTKLQNTLNVFMPKYKGRENEFIMASHVERLKLSKCYLETTQKIERSENNSSNTLFPYKDALTCVTCHNPHVSVRQENKDVFNNACKKCHGSKQKECTASFELRKQNGDNCASCHMKKSGTTDIPHVISTDHFIRKPEKEKEVQAMKEFLGLVCINNPHPDSITIALAYINQFEKFEKKYFLLDSAEKYLNIRSMQTEKNFHAAIQLYYLREEYATLIALAEKFDKIKSLTKVLSNRTKNNRDAWTAYRIGEAYYLSDKTQEAYTYYKLSAALAPLTIEFKNKEAVALLGLKNFSEAIRIFESIITMNPEYPQAYCNLGYALLISDGNKKGAFENYAKALALYPDYEQALLNKAGLLLLEKKNEQAKLILTEILKKNPSNRQAKEILNRMRSI